MPSSSLLPILTQIPQIDDAGYIFGYADKGCGTLPPRVLGEVNATHPTGPCVDIRGYGSFYIRNIIGSVPHPSCSYSILVRELRADVEYTPSSRDWVCTAKGFGGDNCNNFATGTDQSFNTCYQPSRTIRVQVACESPS